MINIQTLIIDDDAEIRHQIKLELKSEKYINVIGEAEDGHDAITMARQAHPDLLIIDIRMPGLNGLETIRLLKNEMPHLKVIVITLFDIEIYREAAKELEVDAFLVKKSIGSELVPTINKIFGI